MSGLYVNLEYVEGLEAKLAAVTKELGEALAALAKPYITTARCRNCDYGWAAFAPQGLLTGKLECPRCASITVAIEIYNDRAEKAEAALAAVTKELARRDSWADPYDPNSGSNRLIGEQKARAEKAEAALKDSLLRVDHDACRASLAEVTRELAAEAAKVAELKKIIQPVFEYMNSCGSDGCDHSVNFCTPEHAIASSLGQALAEKPSPAESLAKADAEIVEAAKKAKSSHVQTQFAGCWACDEVSKALARREALG